MSEFEPVIHWVVALQPEAQALIRPLQLNHSKPQSGAGFPVYESKDGRNKLIVSGIGKVASAAATSWLGAQGDPSIPGAWINFGIAGNQKVEIGSTLRAGRVTDQASNRSWYPVAVWPASKDPFPTSEVVTVDLPQSGYPESRKTVEMEASGFLPTALRFSSIELTQVVKVISDNEESGISDLNPGKVGELCEAAVPELLAWSEVLREIAGEEMARILPPPGVVETWEKLRFSETEKHRLSRLTRWALARHKFSSLPEWIEEKKLRSSKEILPALSALLSDTEGTEN